MIWSRVIEQREHGGVPSSTPCQQNRRDLLVTFDYYAYTTDVSLWVETAIARSSEDFESMHHYASWIPGIWNFFDIPGFTLERRDQSQLWWCQNWTCPTRAASRYDVNKLIQLNHSVRIWYTLYIVNDITYEWCTTYNNIIYIYIFV